MGKLNPLIVRVGGQNDPIDAVPGANATWSNYKAGTTTADSAQAAAGYIDVIVGDASGVPLTVRIPCYLTT